MTEIQSAAEELLATLTHGRARVVTLAYQALPFGTATRLDLGMALPALQRSPLASLVPALPPHEPEPEEPDLEEPEPELEPELEEPEPELEEPDLEEPEPELEPEEPEEPEPEEPESELEPEEPEPEPEEPTLTDDATPEPEPEPPEELPTTSHEAVEDIDIFGDLPDMGIDPLLPDQDASPPEEEEEDLAEEPSLFDLPLSLDAPQDQGDDEDTVVSRTLSDDDTLLADDTLSADETDTDVAPEPDVGPAPSLEDEATLSDGEPLGEEDALTAEDDAPATPSADEYSMGAPRVVQPRLGQDEDQPMVAAVQLLGGGKARPITPTIALDGASEDDDLAAFDGDDDSGHLTLHFEDPVDEDDDEEEDGIHIPELTDIPATPTEPTPQPADHGSGSPAPAELETGDMSRVHDLLAQAADAEAHGDLPQAIVTYGDLLGIVPHQLDAYLGRGRCLMELGDYSAAMSDFQRAEDLSPGSAQPVVEMGNLYFARKEYRRAIEFYNHAVDLDDEHAMAWCRRGICHYYRKEHQDAFEDLQQAFKLDPDIPNIRTYVQMALKAMGER